MRLDLTGRSPLNAPLVTRFAPSPTGYLHLGHVVNAIYVWGIARAVGGRVLLRIEDHDRARSRPEYEEAIIDDLAWLGFVPDEGLRPRVCQRDRHDVYQRALADLGTTSHVYACGCSRRQVGGEHYPGTCRSLGLAAEKAPALRVELGDGDECFDDLILGHQSQTPAAQCGDLLIRDRHGQWTYQFAVTVDDFVQGVTLVIRGADLLESTGRQLRLARLLGREIGPLFVHHPLIRDNQGRKLSKSDGAAGIRELRRTGHTPAEVIGRAAALAGLTSLGTSVTADAVARFWDRI